MSQANQQSLVATARSLVAPGKGILAADESTGTIKRRFDSIRVASTEDTRRDYREMLFRTPKIERHISGVILFDETLRQKAADGTSLTKVLQDRGIIPGIKVDTGAHSLAGAPGELVTEGLDGLGDRLTEYYQLGARFAKWRAVITIGPEIPSDYCIHVNAHALARYAALSQEANLVPIVEPEVLMDGEHSIDRCFEVTLAALHEVFHQLSRQRVLLEGILLKPNMVLSGKEASNRAGPEEVAEKTVTCFQRGVPAAVPGIVFLSGGMADDEATLNLNAMNRYGVQVGAPWQLSFSYGRALQAAPLKAWSGRAANVAAAQQAFHHRAFVVSAARGGTYKPEIEAQLATA
ncbi:MAG: class I fructose-bisphosphate aldolase [Dehalococcoidia bacterium]